MRILVVEDDEKLAERIKQGLRGVGYAVDLTDNGVDGEYLGDEEPYDLVVLDLGLPQRPGLEVLENWRSRNNKVPVMILTARDAWHERVDGLKAGADDYLGKPFHMEELQARIDALVRRSHGEAASGLELAGIKLDEERQTVTTPGGEQFELTGTEFRLLRYFMHHPGVILSKSRLTEHVYEGDTDRDSNVIEVYVTRLRNKLGKGLIETKRGQGYVFAEGHK
ncbi:MAG: response regulator transcription factor [Gammaproteobacteria bacterium]